MRLDPINKENKISIEELEIIPSISVENLIVNSFKQDNANIVDTHKKLDGHLSISQISGDACMRKVYYQYNKVVKDEKQDVLSQLNTKIGSAIHEIIQSSLERNKSLSGIEQFLQDDDLKVCGSTDGYFEEHHHNIKDEIILNDFKSSGLGTFNYISKTNIPLNSHKAQVHWYAYLLKKKHPNLKLDKLKITYINKNGTGFSFNTFYIKKNIERTISYLKETNDKLIAKGRSNDILEAHINNLQITINDIVKEEEFQSKLGKIKEVDFDFDDNLMEKEIQKIKDFWDLIKSNEKEIEKSKIEKGKPKIKLPNKISKKTYCLNCDYLTTCRGSEWYEQNKT